MSQPRTVRRVIIGHHADGQSTVVLDAEEPVELESRQ